MKSKTNHLDRVIVIDVEATCWETREEQGQQPNEIIEIGACQINISDMSISKQLGITVKPRFTKVSKFCTELTGWTQADVDAGVDIVEALEILKQEYDLQPKMSWFSCGAYDARKLGSSGSGSLYDLYRIDARQNPMTGMQHFNIKTLFALKHRLSREQGMDGMLHRLGLQIEGRHHNGMDDAYNIAKIVKSVLS